MNLDTFTTDVRAQAPQLASLGHTFKFDLLGLGCIWIDARNDPPVVCNDDLPADCTITMLPSAVEQVIIKQSMSPVLAVHQGEIIVEGSRDVAERFLTLMQAGTKAGADA